ncbi:hypothetical protein LI82_09140 [Methanococcoides methylutens]|uniref:Uncharacterized protein n=3 Tax=Methanococcoides methylutens TaxID=2226 RepID=A0A099SYC7_METMT|nr:hypothetical protein LI82_09140 [Methanococcoides methylutens]
MGKMSKIAVREYTQEVEGPTSNSFFKPREDPLRHDRVLVFDTETTMDQYQNFKIGSFQIYHEGFIQHEGLFYDPSMLAEKEKEAFLSYARKNEISLYLLNEFIDKVFYPEVFELETLCVGFNIPFDIRRISKYLPKRHFMKKLNGHPIKTRK